MKRLSIVLILIFSVFLIGGCGESSYYPTSPTGVTGLFLNCIENGNYDEARTYMTKDTNLTSFDLENLHDVLSDKSGVVINNTEKAEISGTNATVPAYWTDMEVNKNYKINLSKQGKKWKITSVTKK